MEVKEVSRYILCGLYVVFSVSGLVLIKVGSKIGAMNGVTIPVINLHLSLLSVLGILFYGISFCLYLGVVSTYDIGYIIPLLGGIINVLILLASIFILQEGLGIKSIIGAGIVIIGIVIMNI